VTVGNVHLGDPVHAGLVVGSTAALPHIACWPSWRTLSARSTMPEGRTYGRMPAPEAVCG